MGQIIEVPGQGQVEFPDGMKDADIVAAIKKLSAPSAPPKEHGTLKNIGMGALKGASDIGATLLRPVDYILNKTGATDLTNEQRRAALNEFFHENADPDSLAFKGGELGADMAGTAGAGGVLAKGVRAAGAAIPYAQKLAAALETGGLKLGGPAATTAGGKLANALTRTAGGAVTGGVSAGMINPEYAEDGALIGGALPGVAVGAGRLGNAVASGLETGAKKLMQSAIKPTIKQLQSGDAQIAVETLLEHGINPNEAGVENLRGMIDDKNAKIADLIRNSSATVSKQNVLNALDDVRSGFSNQVSPTADLAAIDNVANDFAAHPMLPSDQIPVQTAQELKQGTYRVLSKKYGQLGSADTEAQKGLARGLKEEIANAVPEVAGLNAEESRLIKTLGVTERRALMELNKNPMGLAALTTSPKSWAMFMADKSALFKSLAARMVNNMSSGAGKAGAAAYRLESPVARAALISAESNQ